MTTKEALHKLIDQMDEPSSLEALDYIQWLMADTDELSDSELAEVARGEAEIAQGQYVTLEQLRNDAYRDL